MISLILPYWDRQQAADKAFATLEIYKGLDLEVIVVDDGNSVPFVMPETSLNARIVRLPLKDKPTPQSKAWNAGVAAANGEFVVLSCVEILHEKPVLEEMLRELENRPEGYVLAAAWCPEFKEWQCHSSVQIPRLPKGTGPAFCGMMRKSTFERIGGFDEIYHDGAGYEDKDFVMNAVSKGVEFVIRDDLVVIHPKSGASIAWPEAGFHRNEMIFISRWEKPINFVCLKAGTAYPVEYVNILFDMVSRNLPAGYPGKFYCITDDAEGLHEAIGVIPLPDDLEKWWGKLYMFKQGLFEDGSRCLFMDLDTVIVGSLAEIVKYQGKFATLRDFYFPQQYGPAVIAWEAGEYAGKIWTEWESQGKPRNPMGDLWWINNQTWLEIDTLQDLYPEKFVSYKVHCKGFYPKGTAVVNFHGQPKPDNCNDDWVQQVWKVGGGIAELEVVANTNFEKAAKNIRAACALDIPWLELKDKHDDQIVIVAGGPSLKKTIEEVKWRKSLGQKVMACNNTAAFLNEHGIIPDYQIIIDARPENAKFLAKANEYFLASQCDASLFTVEPITLFHMNTMGIDEVLPKDRVAHLISSGTTVGLAAMAVAYTQGFRAMHLHGFDSSFEDEHHAYPQSLNDGDSVVEVTVQGETFKTTPWMVKQVQQWQELVLHLIDDDVIVTVAGNGLLPHVAKLLSLN